MSKREKILFIVGCSSINVEGMMELENHHFATIIVKAVYARVIKTSKSVEVEGMYGTIHLHSLINSK